MPLRKVPSVSGHVFRRDGRRGPVWYAKYLTALDLAGLRRLRVHDLRHTFGTTIIGRADILRVKEWMGDADVQTTMRYLQYPPRTEDALL